MKTKYGGQWCKEQNPIGKVDDSESGAYGLNLATAIGEKYACAVGQSCQSPLPKGCPG